MDATAESKDVRFSFDLVPIRRIPRGFFAAFSSALAAPAAPSPARPALSAAATAEQEHAEAGYKDQS